MNLPTIIPPNPDLLRLACLSMKKDTIAEDLKNHPELIPLVDLDSRGNVVCFGWVSPIYTFDKDLLDDLETQPDGNV